MMQNSDTKDILFSKDDQYRTHAMLFLAYRFELRLKNKIRDTDRNML